VLCLNFFGPLDFLFICSTDADPTMANPYLKVFCAPHTEAIGVKSMRFFAMVAIVPTIWKLTVKSAWHFKSPVDGAFSLNVY
jgi:hypothetical protein